MRLYELSCRDDLVDLGKVREYDQNVLNKKFETSNK